MALGAITSEGSSGENIQHFSTLRIRVLGQGNLKMRAYSLDDVKTKDLVPFTLKLLNRIEPNRIVNVVEQRVSFELWTEEVDEWFRINRIIVYAKEIFTSHPGA